MHWNSIALVGATLVAISSPPIRAQQVAEAPCISLEATDLARVARAFYVSSTVEFWRQRPLFPRESKSTGSKPEGTSQWLNEIEHYVPSEVRLSVSGESAAFLRNWMCFSAVMRHLYAAAAGDPQEYEAQVAAAAPLLREKLVQIMDSIYAASANLTVDFPDESTSDLVLEKLTAALTPLGATTVADGLTLPVALPEFLHGALTTDLPEPISAELRSASADAGERWGRELEVSVLRSRTRINVRIGASREIAPSASGRTGAFLRAEWDLGNSLADEIGDAVAHVAGAAEDPSGESRASALREATMRRVIARGDFECRLPDGEPLELEWRVPKPERTTEVGSSGLLSLIPPGTSVWQASGSRSLVEVLDDSLTSGLESLAGFERSTGQARPVELAEATAALLQAFRESSDAFALGALVMAGIDVSSGSNNEQESVPSMTCVARPTSVEAAEKAIHQWFEILGSRANAEVELSDAVSSCTVDLGEGAPTLTLLAALDDKHVFLSTSRIALASAMSRELYCPGGPFVHVAEGTVTAFETTGVRVGDLVGATLRYLARRFPLRPLGETGWSLFDLAGAAEGWLHGIGRLEARSAISGDWMLTRLRLYPRPSGGGDLVTRFRAATGLDSWPSGQMLVARGVVTVPSGTRSFEAVFARDGSSWLRTSGKSGEATYSSAFGDDGKGRLPMPTESAFEVQAWGMATVGSWAFAEHGVRAQLVDETSAELTVRLQSDEWLTEPFVVLDRQSHRCRGMGYEWRGRASGVFSLTTTYSDYRSVDELWLPHKIITPTLSTTYAVESWEYEPFDENRLLVSSSTPMRFASGAAAVDVAVDEGWFVIDGELDGKAGRIAIAPLRAESFYIVQEGAEHQQPMRLDLRVGPLSGGPIQFHPSPPEHWPFKDVIAVVGVNALGGACVRFDFRRKKLELLPPGSFTGDDWQGLRMVDDHLALEARLPGGSTTWASPGFLDGSSRNLWIKQRALHALESRLGKDDCALVDHRIPYLDLAGYRLNAKALQVFDPMAPSDDPTPIVFSLRALRRHVIEFDFPNGRYRLVPR